MSWHLRHDWVEVGRKFNPPRGRVKAEGDPYVVADIVQKSAHGFTQVEYACRREGCTKRKIVEVLGRAPNLPDDSQ